MAEITQALVRDIFNYDAETGKLFYRDRTSPWSLNPAIAPSVKSRWLGKECGVLVKGYLCVNILGKRYSAHRIIWLWVHGTLPDKDIDHINGDRSDNRIENLRCVDGAENQKNMGIRKDNSTGFHGVRYLKQRNNYRTEITINGKPYFIGEYDELGVAVEVRKAVEKFVGFHPNHGGREAFHEEKGSA
ncbi:HNH endonuclease [Agrobacterium tumefaciens]|nr:HNH endonuclease [Agrobacterium tumefaciens]TQN59604.1 HNH endonuclease [Agrobacterium tumefaciens]